MRTSRSSCSSISIMRPRQAVRIDDIGICDNDMRQFTGASARHAYARRPRRRSRDKTVRAWIGRVQLAPRRRARSCTSMTHQSEPSSSESAAALAGARAESSRRVRPAHCPLCAVQPALPRGFRRGCCAGPTRAQAAIHDGTPRFQPPAAAHAAGAGRVAVAVGLMMRSPVGSRVSSWRVDGELGRGGMASVHAVTHTKFGKRAAIKIAHRSVLGDSFTRRRRSCARPASFTQSTTPR